MGQAGPKGALLQPRDKQVELIAFESHPETGGNVFNQGYFDPGRLVAQAHDHRRHEGHGTDLHSTDPHPPATAGPQDVQLVAQALGIVEHAVRMGQHWGQKRCRP